MSTVRAALLGALLITSPLASSHAATLAAPPPAPGAAATPSSQARPVHTPRGAQATSADRARLQHFEGEVHTLKRQMWRLRMRRRQFLAQGMPEHAHRVHQRIIALGWRLRRVQAAERASMAAAPMSRRR
ncbi:MAG: hypothetical protein ACYCVM_10390 [Acidiferrobacter sp.]